VPGLGDRVGCYFCTKDYFVSTKHAINYKLKALGPFTARPCCCAWLRVKSNMAESAAAPTKTTTTTTITSTTTTSRNNLKDNNLSLQAVRAKGYKSREWAWELLWYMVNYIVYKKYNKQTTTIIYSQKFKATSLSFMQTNPTSHHLNTLNPPEARKASDNVCECLLGSLWVFGACFFKASDIHIQSHPPTHTHIRTHFH